MQMGMGDRMARYLSLKRRMARRALCKALVKKAGRLLAVFIVYPDGHRRKKLPAQASTDGLYCCIICDLAWP